MQEDAVAVTADTSTNDAGTATAPEPSNTTAKFYALVAALFLLFGTADLLLLAILQVAPDLFGSLEFLTPGRLGPAARFFLLNGWVITGLLGASMYAISSATKTPLHRRPLATAGLLLIAVGAMAGSFGIVFGLQSGIDGFQAPLWARAITVAGWVLAALAVSGTSKASDHGAGATGWYLTAAAWWLAAAGIISLFPPADGVGGTLQTAFSQAAIVGFFVVIASIGLLYHVVTTLSGTDPATQRPLSALGFWSAAIVWGSMSATGLIYSPAPDWFETLGVAMAIAAFVPALTIVTDLGLMAKGTLADIGDKASVRYVVVAGASLLSVTAVNFLLTWRSTSAIVGHTTVENGRDLLIYMGVASFAIFASHTMMQGGRPSGSSLHFAWSVSGLTAVVVGYVGGGIATGFSWAAGPASTVFVNAGPAWEITAETQRPFAWITIAGAALFFIAQFTHLASVIAPAREPLPRADGPVDYDLEFEGAVAAPTRGRLVWGAAAVFAFSLLFTGVFPMMDPANSESTILGDTARDLPANSIELDGHNVYVSAGCAECHTQLVRPVGTDVGLGPVSQAGDYVHESPVLLGAVRGGPDLMHFASSPGFDAEALRAHLIDPRETRPWSTMPSYGYLSDEDLNALIAYIETLR